VPEFDRAAIAAVLDAPPAPAATGIDRSAVPEFSLADIDRYNTNRTVDAGAYRARIEFVRPVARVAAGVVREQEVLVENLGDERWPWGADAQPPIRLGYRWHSAGGDGEALGEGPRTPFTETVEPGARSLVKMLVEAPARPGRYVLSADIVHEHVRWFGCEARMEVEVEPAGPGREPERGGRRRYFAQAREHGVKLIEAARDYRRWVASLDPVSTPLGDRRPWMTFEAQRVLERELRPDMRVCEFGTGGSTPFLLDRAGGLVSIEWDEHWAGRVRDAVPPGRAADWTVELAPPQEDPGGRQRDPSDPDAYVSASPAFLGFAFRNYARTIDRFEDEAFDVVVVAGRARPSCLRHALAKVRRGGMVVLDHAERSWYHPALALAEPAEWIREDVAGPGPYTERFWRTAILRRRS
jgi:hypothetical protein